MNHARIGLGLAAWFLGIIVPVAHHVLLHFPLAFENSSNDLRRMWSVYDAVHWTEWGYLALMTVTGAVLVVSGILSRPVPPAA